MPTKSNNIGGRGGRRPGAGRKKSAVKEKANNGNPGGRRLEILDIPDVEGVEMPKPHDFLSAEQRDGSELQASEIYEETWQWLKKIGCASKVSPQLLERYGIFGTNTEKAVKIFQKKYKLEVDGIVGPKTRAKIKYLLK